MNQIARPKAAATLVRARAIRVRQFVAFRPPAQARHRCPSSIAPGLDIATVVSRSAIVGDRLDRHHLFLFDGEISNRRAGPRRGADASSAGN